MEKFFYSVEFWMTLFVLVFVVIIAINYRITLLKRKLADFQIRLLISLRAQEKERKKVLEQLAMREEQPHLMEDIGSLFGEKTQALQRRFPALTEQDLKVLVLIGLGTENHEIMRLTGMSKRTYYKRRQLIAQRMGTTAAQLDPIAQQEFASAC